jgi:hypothetical protein
MTPEETPGSQMALALLFDQQPEILKSPCKPFTWPLRGDPEQDAAPGFQCHAQACARGAWESWTGNRNLLDLARGADAHYWLQFAQPEAFERSLTQMQKLTVQWDFLRKDGDPMWASCVLLPFVAFDRDKVFYSYAAQIKPMLFDSKIYARLDLRIQRTFRLDPAAALYEWVNCFRTNPSKRTNEMTWTDWRWCIYGEVSETSILNEYKIFKRDKLKPAIKEINEKSDLTIELIENRDGSRSVKYLQFIVEEKQIFRAIPDVDDKGEEKRLEDLACRHATARKSATIRLRSSMRTGNSRWHG